MEDQAQLIVLKRRPEGNQGKIERLRRETLWHKICYSPGMGRLERKHEAFAKVWRSRLQMRLSWRKAEAPASPGSFVELDSRKTAVFSICRRR
jgi:hypothetical protein